MSMPSRSRTGSGPLIAGLLILIAVVVFVLVLLANNVTATDVWNSFFPVHNQVPATDRSLSTKSLYDFVFYIALVIFLLVEGLIIYSAFRFRRKPGDDELPPQTHGNNLVEIVWTLIPTVIVGVLFVFSWQTLNVVDATVKTDVHVRAIAARFQWSFEYLNGPAPDAPVLFKQVITTGEDGGLFLPVGVPITVDLRSEDVIHAFYVPMFLFKRDVVPGKNNTFDFTIDDAGTYCGQCAELCGSGHAAMLFDVHAVDKATFDTWLQTQIDQANATPPPPPSGGPSGQPGASGQPGPSGQPGGATTLDLAAQNIAYSTDALSAPAGQPFTIAFNNEDAGVPHNVAINDAAGTQVFKGDIITGPAIAPYAVPALAAGTYQFICSVHPNMTGTLTVQ